jgi:hypothetical protein
MAGSICIEAYGKEGRILLFLKKKKQKDFFRRCAAGVSWRTALLAFGRRCV